MFFLNIFVALNVISFITAYFTMTDIEMNLPIMYKHKQLLKNKILATIYAQEQNTAGFVIKNGENFLKINSSSGNISFASAFFKTAADDVKRISAEISTKESIFNSDAVQFLININPFKKLDCESIEEDLCFWHSVSYRIRENRDFRLIGSLSSPYFREICDTFIINYTLVKGQNDFELVPPSNTSKAWMIRTKTHLDRDILNSKNGYASENLNFTVICSVQDKRLGKLREISRDFPVEILDEDDNPPQAQEEKLDVRLPSNSVKKGQEVEHAEMIFSDVDSPPVNNYIITLLDDKLKLLEPKCATHVNDQFKMQQTAITCKLVFTKDAQLPDNPYSVVLQINDTNLHSKLNTVASVPIHLYVNDTSNSIKSPRKYTRPLLLYPNRNITLFRTAGPYARVTQPREEHNIAEVHNFTLTTLDRHKGILDITSTEGIIYVRDITLLVKSDHEIRINVTWKRNETVEFDEFSVLFTEEASPTCVNITEWNSCSEYSKPKKCWEACGIATGGASSVNKKKYGIGGRCMWRGERNPGRGFTHLYSTCTPDIDTCSDGKCDSLEMIDIYICPQDCTEKTNFPTLINKKTGRGIAAESGICTCDRFGSCSCTMSRQPNQNVSKHSGPTTTSSLTKASLMNHSVPIASTHNLAGTPKKQTGPNVNICGTTCMLSTAAAAIFLIGTVGVAIACWKFGGVQKVVRAKFTDDTPDLSAPLSEYVDRGVVVDNLQLTFDVTSINMNNSGNKYLPDPKWEFPRTQLIIEQTLGEGEFGRVLRARALDIEGHPGYTTVAVKTLKDDAREPELADLLSEYELLKGVSHPNVIRLLGASTTPGGPIYLIIEFAQYGSLRNYIRRSRRIKSDNMLSSSRTDHYEEPNPIKVTAHDVLSFAWQICNGMAYLTDIKLVHRDLAARNVLLAAEKICKISDFGLTRDIYEDDAYFKKSKGRVPVKWMAPESLADHIYTSKSDVWSFGILAWELVTLGASPYPGIEVQNLFHLLRTGYRMECPENCSQSLYNIMRSCWAINPEDRPSFRDLATQFEKMLSDQVQYLDITDNAIVNRSYFVPSSEIIDDKKEAETVNNLSQTQPDIKCGDTEKLSKNNDFRAPEYEIPILTESKLKTPSNECPQYYTNMAAAAVANYQ